MSQLEHHSSPEASCIVEFGVHQDTVADAVARCEGQSPSVSVDRLAPVSLLAELGDLRRFPNVGSFMAVASTPNGRQSGEGMSAKRMAWRHEGILVESLTA